MMDSDAIVREELRFLLTGGNAHMSLDEAVVEFPEQQMNTQPPHVPYTPWHLLEHIRRTQKDILDFIRDPHYTAGRWPDDYWPPRDAQANRAAWNETIASFHEDLDALVALLDDRSIDLYTPLPHGEGQTILREMQLVADHNAYHIGEFAILRQVMQTWGNHRH